MAATGESSLQMGDDVNSTPIGNLTMAPTQRMTGELSSRKNAKPLEPIVYNPDVSEYAAASPQGGGRGRPRRYEDDGDDEYSDDQDYDRPRRRHQQQQQQFAQYPAFQTAFQPPAVVADQPSLPPKKSSWLKRLERHGRAFTVAFLIFGVLWYAVPKLATISWLHGPAGTPPLPALSTVTIVGLSLAIAGVYAAIDTVVLTVD